MAVGDVKREHAIGAGILGIFIFLCGLGDTIIGIIWIDRFHVTKGTGLWSGIPLIVTGILGIIVWTKRNKGVAIGFLVMCILCIIIAAVQAIVAWIVYAIWVLYTGASSVTSCNQIGSDCHCYSQGKTRTFSGTDCDAVNTVTGGLLALVILNALGAIFSFIGSIIGCMSTCCASQTPGAVVVQQPPVLMTTHTGPAGYPQQAGYPPQTGYQQAGYSQQAGYLQQASYPQQQMQTSPPPQYSENQPGAP